MRTSDVQRARTGAEFSLSPKLGRYLFTLTPLASFASSRSYLFRNTAHRVRQGKQTEGTGET